MTQELDEEDEASYGKLLELEDESGMVYIVGVPEGEYTDGQAGEVAEMLNDTFDEATCVLFRGDNIETDMFVGSVELP